MVSGKTESWVLMGFEWFGFISGSFLGELFPCSQQWCKEEGWVCMTIDFSGSLPSFLLLTCGSQREPFTRSISITWEFRNANSSIPSCIFWIRNLGSKCAICVIPNPSDGSDTCSCLKTTALVSTFYACFLYCLLLTNPPFQLKHFNLIQLTKR